MNRENKIELVVFDWAGTTTDFGSQAPVHVFDRTFADRGMHFSREEINAPMGMEKKAHIRSMLSTENGTRIWKEAMNRMWTEEDIEELYQSFEAALAQVVAEYSNPIPGVPKTVALLRQMGIKIGSTTGYTSEMMQHVLPVAEKGGYAPDCVVTPDVTKHSRPSPFMIYECMRQLNVYPVSHVVKAGDTAMDILEGVNAGAWTVGILTGSNLMGMTEEEYRQALPETIDALKAAARKIYVKAGAHMIIDSIQDLPEAIKLLDDRLQEEVIGAGNQVPSSLLKRV